MLHGSTAGTAPQVQHNKPFASPAGSLGFAIAPRACLEPRHACCQGQAPAPAAAPMGGSPQHPTCGQPAPNTAVPAQRWVRSRIAGAALRADGAGEGGARAGAKGVEDLVHAHIVPRRRRGRGRAGQWGAWQWKAGCKALNSGSSNPQGQADHQIHKRRAWCGSAVRGAPCSRVPRHKPGPAQGRRVCPGGQQQH